jgi:hypothetical protein
LSESLPPLPRDLEALLEAERGQREPAGLKDRVLRRLEAKLPLDSDQKVPARQAPRDRSRVWWWLTRASVGGALSAAQLAVALGAGGAVVVGVGALIKHSVGVRKSHEASSVRTRPPNPAGAVPAPVEAPPAEAPPPAPVPAPAQAPPVLPVPGEASQGGTARPPVAAPERHRPAAVRQPEAEPAGVPRSERNTALAEERVLLEEARVALLRGDTGSALEALTTHAEKFPNSPFAEEREALMVREAVRAGSYKEARVWFDRFREHYPNSPMLPVLESSLKELTHDDKH